MRFIYYELKETFWQEFTVAEPFGELAVRDTYNRVFGELKNNVEYVTELVMVLKLKIWSLYGKNASIARVYNELWMEADWWCVENLKGEDLSYFFNVTD